MCAQGVVMHCTGSDFIKVTTQLKTSDTAENIGKHLKSSDIILRTTEDPSQIIKFSLKRISTVGPKSLSGGGVGSGWLSQTSPIPRSPDGDKKKLPKWSCVKYLSGRKLTVSQGSGGGLGRRASCILAMACNLPKHRIFSILQEKAYNYTIKTCLFGHY